MWSLFSKILCGKIPKRQIELNERQTESKTGRVVNGEQRANKETRKQSEDADNEQEVSENPTKQERDGRRKED